MPIHNLINLEQTPQGNVLSSKPLQIIGPRIPVAVSVPPALATWLQEQGRVVPTSISGTALIDTGATVTCVDRDVITTLGVSPVGAVRVFTPSGDEEQAQYPAHLDFPGTSLPGLDLASALGSTLKAQGIIALIGRDALAHMVLVYHGPLGICTLAL